MGDELREAVERMIAGIESDLIDLDGEDEARNATELFFDLLVSRFQSEVIEAVERTDKFEVVEYEG